MANKKTAPDRREAKPAETPPAEAKSSETKSGHDFVMFRETIESIVVAFVLAFLFRTFEAEAFVIPTGSMSPSLQGQHKDVHCLQCGHRFRTTASSEGENRDRLMARLRSARNQEEAEHIKSAIESLDVVGGMCPMCRYLMPMRPDLPRSALGEVGVEDIEYQPSYPGDRILVNKYGLDFSEPERWDVVVFKFPGDGNMNYIKRLVGLPGEQIQLYQGDVFTRSLGDADAEFMIERKPVDKVEAMLELVHDTDYEPSTLYNAGWPLRWAATTPDGWKVDAKPGEQTVVQSFSIDTGKDAPMAWLRYRHQLPDDNHWQIARRIAKDGVDAVAKEAGQSTEEFNQQFKKSIHPQLIVDFNSYNARLLRGFVERDGWQIRPNSGQDAGSFGTEWVGDLAVDATVEVAEARGELALDLVEAGNHFRATINLADGKVALSAIDGRTGEPLDFKASGQTSVNAPGTYEIRFANVDDQLLLWVDGTLVDLGDATYNPDKLLSGGRKGMIPWASENSDEDQGDLAPVGIGAQDAKLTITRLAVLRDIYYIATKYEPGFSQYIADYDLPAYGLETLFSTPDYWNVFAGREKKTFDVEEGQLFVMGDNSPESKDCRLWMMSGMSGDHPGGPYLDRRLLIGKAVSVFWPHSWGSIPFLKMLPGFPNFGDMRIVR